MNGRIYDPGIGRFLSADPLVQAPEVTQNFNRYSYVVNNPLSYTDPTGFNIFGDFFNWLSGVFGKTGAQVIIGVVGAVVAIGAWYAAPLLFTGLTGISTTVTLAGGATALSTTGLVVAGVGAGFSSAFASTILSGASLGQAFEAGLIGGVIGGITAGAGGTLFRSAADDALGEVFGKGVGRALLGGALSSGASAVEGGNPRDGFIGAFASALISPSMNGFGGKGFESVVLRVMASAIAGGTAAQLTGGKFANGAITAAFVRLVYEEVRVGSQAGTKNMGSATSKGFNALTVVGDLAGKIWNFPNTVIGFAAQLVLAPFAYANGGGFQFRNNALQLVGVPFFRGAITIGNTQTYFTRSDPTFDVTYNEQNVNTGLHEQFHTYQQQLWGIFFWPAYLLSGPVASLSNPFEAGAQDFARRNTPGGW